MYAIHYVVNRESDHPVQEEQSEAGDLATAIASAKQKIKNLNIAIPWNPERPHPIGFLIFDASGREVYREYMG